jgi:hypothetical protein
MKREYDVDSAITFLLVGLGIGALLTMVVNTRMEPGVSREKIKRWSDLREPPLESDLAA